ncbi:MAG: hypothetical protein Q9183_001694 [Haloplaca sp. 2 TL-2023]
MVFQLPAEILAIILEYISEDSLASLALVSKDCCQLARSRRFASINLDYSFASSNLVKTLMLEAHESLGASTTSSSTRLGPCIRRIMVATSPQWVEYRHRVGSRDLDFKHLPHHEVNDRLRNASESFFDMYMTLLPRILNRTVLPNLELLDWRDRTTQPPKFFNALPTSTIRHLKICGTQIDGEYGITLPDGFKGHTWPLKTLHLTLGSSFLKTRSSSPSTLMESILQLCASTLEDLSLKSLCGKKDPYSFKSKYHFPKLHRLSISSVDCDGASVLEALIQGSLRYLEIGMEIHDPIVAKYLGRCGTLPLMKTFVWYHSRPDDVEEPPYQFLLANPQIERLLFGWAVADKVLQENILPMLKNQYRSLASLSLVWGGISIPESGISAIAELKTLRQIHLSAGNQIGWKHDWVIDHDCLRRHLSNLPLLEKLAFSRDTYSRPDFRDPQGERYYVYGNDLAEESKDSSLEWEQEHLDEVLIEAQLYADSMPNLTWMYFGQIPMGVTARTVRRKKKRKRGARRGEYYTSHERTVSALFDKRDSCETALKRIFGGSTE